MWYTNLCLVVSVFLRHALYQVWTGFPVIVTYPAVIVIRENNKYVTKDTKSCIFVKKLFVYFMLLFLCFNAFPFCVWETKCWQRVVLLIMLTYCCRCLIFCFPFVIWGPYYAHLCYKGYGFIQSHSVCYLFPLNTVEPG